MRKHRIALSKEDRAFFQSFYESYKNFLYKTALAYESEQAEREDLIQEALLRLMKNVSVLRELTHYKTLYYIVLTVRTAFIDIHRQRDKNAVLPLESEAVSGSVYIGASQEQELSGGYARDAARQLREQLTERDWLILTGKILMGYTHEELAQALDIKPENVRMVYKRAKEKARRLLREQDLAGGDECDG